MLQNAKYTASTFLPPTHPVGKLAARAHKEREYSAKALRGPRPFELVRKGPYE